MIGWKNPYGYGVYDSNKGKMVPLYHHDHFVTLEDAIGLLAKNEPVTIDIGSGTFTLHRDVVDIFPVYRETVKITIDRGYTLEGKASCFTHSVKCPYFERLENGNRFCARMSKVISRDKTYKHYVPVEGCPVWRED
jgi:hypothetical protein